MAVIQVDSYCIDVLIRGDDSYLAIADFHTVGHCPDYEVAPVADMEGVGSNQHKIAPVADMQGTSSSQYKTVPVADMEGTGSNQHKAAPVADMEAAGPSQRKTDLDRDVNEEDRRLPAKRRRIESDLAKQKIPVKGTKAERDKEQEGHGVTTLDTQDGPPLVKLVPVKSVQGIPSPPMEDHIPAIRSEGGASTMTVEKMIDNSETEVLAMLPADSNPAHDHIPAIHSEKGASAMTVKKDTDSLGKEVREMVPAETSPVEDDPSSTGRSQASHTDVIEHYNRCHRLEFPILKFWTGPTEAKATRELVDPEAPDEEIGLSSKMLLASTSLSQQALLALDAGKPLRRIHRTLDLMLLSTVPRLPLPQNFMCDIIAVVLWVSPEVVPAGRLGLKRELRLGDHSTTKRVLLSVFADPEHFTPAVGTVALFRSVKNHRFDGYSLNAYAEDCSGYDWFITNPDWVDPRRTKEVREWWALQQELRHRTNYATIVENCHESCHHGYDKFEADARKEMDRLMQDLDDDDAIFG